jgi:PAS domain S-box-containing protein
MQVEQPVPETEPNQGKVAIWIAVGSFFGLYLAWLFFGGQDEPDRNLIGSLSLFFTSLSAACLAVWARGRFNQARMRRAWNWLSLGLVFWCVGDLCHLILQTVAPEQVNYSIAVDVVYLAGTIALGGGLWLYPRVIRQLASRLYLLLDAAIAMTAFFTLAWIILFQPLFGTYLGYNLVHVLTIIYPSVDLLLVLFVIILFLVSEPESVPLGFGWMTMGLICYSVSDLIYASLSLMNGYHVGSPVDMGWIAGDTCMVLAILVELRRSSRPESVQSLYTNRRNARLQSRLSLIATLILGLYSLLLWLLLGQFNQLGLWVTVALSLAMIARQGILTGEIGLQQYATLVNSVAEPIFICDTHGKLRLFNPALLDATGYARDVIRHFKLSDLLSPSEICPELLAEGLKGGWSGELSLRRQDGQLIPVSVALRLISPTGDQRLALAVTAHDLSEQKQQQVALQQAYEQIAAAHAALEQFNAQLEVKVAQETANLSQAYAQLEQQNQALQSLDGLKSDFVSMVSHELRAPLTNIMGGIELVLSKSGQIPPTDVQTLQLVQAEILRLKSFVETILDLSALDAGRAPLYPAPVELDDQIRLLRQQMGHLQGTQRIQWQIPAGLPPILADGRALNSILFHLLDNALKYAPEGVIIVSAGLSGREIWVRVEDEGPGIPEDAQGYLFERFYRYKPSDSQSVYGHGLGLYIVHRLLEMMGGQISFNNRQPGGACFTFSLPVAANLEEAHDI